MKSWKLVLIWVAVIVAIIAMFIFGFQSVQNTAISMEEQINSATSAIDVQYKRRADLIKNLAACVEKYDKHESETLIKLAEARSSGKSGDVSATAYIGAVAESYPQLLSEGNYNKLMTELALTENKISNVRENYNTQVKDYKRYVRKFPNSSILGLLGYNVLEFDYLKYDAPADAPDVFGSSK